jgi:hypothetical protein
MYVNVAKQPAWLDNFNFVPPLCFLVICGGWGARRLGQARWLGKSQCHGHRHLMDCHIGIFDDMAPNK